METPLSRGRRFGTESPDSAAFRRWSDSLGHPIWHRPAVNLLRSLDSAMEAHRSFPETWHKPVDVRIGGYRVENTGIYGRPRRAFPERNKSRYRTRSPGRRRWDQAVAPLLQVSTGGWVVSLLDSAGSADVKAAIELAPNLSVAHPSVSDYVGDEVV